MSTRWDGRELLEPIAPDRPCGESLEDTPLLASFDAFHVFGHLTPPDPPPEWEEIRNRALDALRKSKDLRLLAFLGTAMLRTDGLPAFAQTLTIASQWLTSHWAQTYPLIDEDALLRRNALNCFADSVAVVDGLRRLPLVSSREHGTFSLRDIDMATGLAAPSNGDVRPDEAQINAAFAGMPLAELEVLQQSTASALEALKSINVAMVGGAGAEAVPDFDPLSAHIAKMDRVLRQHLSARTVAAGADTLVAGASGGEAVPVGAIRSRQDAIRALDAVAELFRRNEPSSPIPLFVDRAKRLVSKNFLEVLADVAPEAVPQARAVGGLPQNE
jgi:type VI secretion system protein ImpA